MADNPREQLMQERREQRHQSRLGQTYARFITELSARGRMGPQQAEQAAVAVLSVLKLRLFGGEARDLESQLPQRLQELLQDQPSELPGEPPANFGADEFLRRVAKKLGVSYEEAERTARVVFWVVRDTIDEGEAHDVEAQLPPDLWELWALES
ncbi:MAG TPA: DUF2267 domain-containing protein [Myxococcaceae bacterium]|nr:DUF2267 domain-containing protein [Myxococcaceae bacterium]